VNSRRPERARNEGSRGPKRRDDTRCTSYRRRINYRTAESGPLSAVLLSHHKWPGGSAVLSWWFAQKVSGVSGLVHSALKPFCTDEALEPFCTGERPTAVIDELRTKLEEVCRLRVIHLARST